MTDPDLIKSVLGAYLERLRRAGRGCYFICGQSGARRPERQQQVDQVERRRTAAATEAQGNANPFIDDPKLVTRIADF